MSRHLPIACCLALALGAVPAGAQSPAASAAPSAPLAFDVPALPLADALAQWSRQTGVALQAAPGLTAGRSAPAVAGTLTPRQALDRLLAGSGLVVVEQGTAWRVERSSAAAEAELPAIVARAAAPVATTEGSGSYTTGAASTATGLNLALRDTPQSVSVITRERIDDQAMSSVADALRSTIGVSVKPVDRGRNNVSARGFDINNYQFDGVPVATGNVGIETASTAIYDRIEVVRGATGLTSGPGDPSAAVNLVRKHADSRSFAGSLSVELGSWKRRFGTVDLSTPLNADASVRGRFVARLGEQDAFIDLEHTKQSVLYGVIDADLGPSTRLSVGASDQRDQRSGVLWAGLPYWYSDGSRTDWGRSKTTAADWNQWDTREQMVFATLSHEFANRWLVRGYAQYHRQVEDSKLLWLSGDPDPVTGEGMVPYPYHYLTKPEQIDLGVTATGPFRLFGREHELTAGLLRNKLKSGWTNRDAVAELPPVGDIRDWDGSYPEPELTDRYVASKNTTRQTAFYTAARLQTTDRLKFILGGRYTEWELDEEAAAWTAEAYTIRHHEFTPYAGVIFDLNEHLSAYGSYADIFKPQTNRQRNGDYLDPLKGKSYELGLKGEWMNGRLNGHAAVFRTRQENYAVPDGFIEGTAQPAFRAASGVKVQGYELEVTGEIRPGWSLMTGWTQFSAKDADDMDVAVDHSRRQFKLQTKLRLSGPWDRLSVGGGVQWEGGRPARAINPGTQQSEKVGQSSYALFDLMASYDVSKDFSLQLNVDNVFDKTYRSGSYWWGSPYTYGEPRRVLVTADVRF